MSPQGLQTGVQTSPPASREESHICALSLTPSLLTQGKLGLSVRPSPSRWLCVRTPDGVHTLLLRDISDLWNIKYRNTPQVLRAVTHFQLSSGEAWGDNAQHILPLCAAPP